MAYKLIAFFLLAVVALVQAAVVVPAAPAVPVELEEVDSLPQYKYAYDVQDSLSGDSKGHVEERDGDIVRGEYTLVDADGFRRTVTYTADAVNGFNAVVRRERLVDLAPVVEAERIVKPAVALV